MPGETEASELSAAILALEAQRSILGDAVVETALGPLRARLATLEAPAAESQRKVATILFADVSGFTALSETLDAEVVASIMNDLWVLVDQAITSHGGRIDKHIGDAVMALWGAEIAREDDPEQAIRAALAMQTAIDMFSTTHSAPLAMRVGLHTGPVLLGKVGSTGEFTAMGDAVNLASRLEHAAPVGGVLISHDTYRHVRGVFDVQTREPLMVKGKLEPVQTYVVQQAKPRAFRQATRGVEGVETQMIGRDSEFGLLQDAYYDVTHEGEMRMVTVMGEAGVGKSRLLYEFNNWLELLPELVLLFKGRATPTLESVPYSLFRDLFAFRFNIRDGDSATVALEKFRAGMLTGSVGDRPSNGTDDLAVSELTADQVDLVGHWLGFDFSSSAAVDRLLGSPEFATVAQAHLMRYLRQVSAAEPVIIFLEDIHWADDSSLDLVSHLVKTLPHSQLLIIGVARPMLYERRARWSEGESNVSRVDLRPLSRRANRTLVDEILRRVDDIPETLSDLIVNAAEGNPYFTEEVIKMLIDQGVIVRHGLVADSELAEERWRVEVGKLAEARVPPTLTGLLQARLDGLPQMERELLQRAAVVGRLFWDGVVADLAQTEQETIRSTLASMRDRELIFQRERSAFDGTDEFVFKHNLLRDVAYERVLLKWRQEFHGRVARWLEGHAGERLNEYLALIAQHYERAGENKLAAAYLLRAGKEALQANANVAAQRLFERVLALEESISNEDSPQAIEALILLGEIVQFQGDYETGEKVLQRGLVGAQRLGEERLQAEALFKISRTAVNQGDFERAVTLLLEEAVPLARQVGGSTLIETLLAVTEAYWLRGDLSEMQRYSDEALQLAHEYGDKALESGALTSQTRLAATLGDLELTLQRGLEALNIARDSGNLHQESITLLNLGSIYYQLGQYEDALSYGRVALQKAREMGFARAQMLILCNLAQANLKLGDRNAARRGVREALQFSGDRGRVPDVLFAVQVAAEILADENERGKALQLLWFAHDHAAADFQSRNEIAKLLEQWATDDEKLAAARTAAAELDFDDVVARIMTDFEP